MSSPTMTHLNEIANPAHNGAAGVAALREWFESEPVRPFVCRDFLDEEFAQSLSTAMRALPVWSRCSTAYKGMEDVREVTEKEWAQLPDRAAQHYIARPLPDALRPGAMPEEHQRILKRFLGAVVIGDGLRSFLSAGTGLTLADATSIEMAQYHQGDQIRPHQDLLPGRVLACNFYLDPDYRPGDGGELSLASGEDSEIAVEPLFNSFSVIPIGPRYRHAVLPFRADRRGRETVSIGVHATTEEGSR